MRRTDRPNGTLELSVAITADATPDEHAVAVVIVPEETIDEVSVTLVPPVTFTLGCFLMTAYA